MSAAVLVAFILGAGIVGLALGGSRQLRTARAATRALEPGFTGQFQYRNDNFRTGQNLAETVLTPSTVNAAQFGLQFTDTIDGAAYAQPLYVPNVSVRDKGTHNVVYVATENDSVYAFDADNQGPPLWRTSFINPVAGITAVPASDLGCGDLTPIIGITATPVIDPDTGTLYVVSKVKLGPGSYQQQLHALDITTGLERANSPVTIAASVPGTASDAVNGVVSFDPLRQNDRPALTLANGVVYLSFASHCDIGPYHGWILAYDETTLAQEVVYNSSPNGQEAGFWQSGNGPGVDTNGDLIAITGNGTFDTSAPSIDYGDSFLRLTLGGGTLSVSSFFTPLNEQILDDDDLDMGSGGPLLLPDQPGPNPHLMVGAGKLGILYLVNRDSMGGFNPSGDQVVQELNNPTEVGSMFSTPAYWQGMVPNVGLQNMIYTIGVNDRPKMFAVSSGLIQTPPASTAPNCIAFGFPGASPVISANGTTGGIMWAIDSSGWEKGAPAILYSFDATNLNRELYDSNLFSSDNPGPAVKFTVPTVANGSVYVGTQTQLAVFGFFPSGARPMPTATPPGGPPVVVDVGAPNGSFSDGRLSLVEPANPAPGNLFCVSLSEQTSGSATWTLPAGWLQVATNLTYPPTLYACGLVSNIGFGPYTFIPSGGGAGLASGGILQIRGENPSTTLDVVGTPNCSGSSTPPSANNIRATQDDLVLWFEDNGNSVANSAPSGFTPIYTNANSNLDTAGSEEFNNVDTGAQTATSSGGLSTNCAEMIGIAPAAAGPTATPTPVGVGRIKVSPGHLNLGEAAFGAKKTEHFKISNTLKDTMLVGNVAQPIGPGAAQFKISGTTSFLLPHAAPGDVITVQYTPSAAGAVDKATIVVTSSDSAHSSINVALTGKGKKSKRK